MADRQALNATFFAFSKREPGGALLGAGISFAIASIVMLALFGFAIWQLLGGMHFVEWYQSVLWAASKGAEPTQPPQGVGNVFLILPLELVFFVIFFVVFAAFEASCQRWMIRGERSSPLNLNFGADMWRIYGTYWMWVLYFFLTWIVFWILLIVGGIGLGASIAGKNHALIGLIAFLFCIVWACGWTWVAVRLAPAGATTVGMGKFEPLKAWTVSRGRFWELFGAYLVLFLLYFVAYMVVASIIMGTYYSVLFSHLDFSMASSDPEAFTRQYTQANIEAVRSLFSSPTSIAIYTVSQIGIYVLIVVFYVALYGVSARAVQAALEEGKITREPAAA